MLSRIKPILETSLQWLTALHKFVIVIKWKGHVCESKKERERERERERSPCREVIGSEGTEHSSQQSQHD